MSSPSPSSSPRRRATAVFAAAALVFFASWLALQTNHFRELRIVDTPVYESYGERMRAGDVPYRDFAVEYPPGSLPVFVAPSYLGDDYETAFRRLVLVLGLVCLAFVVLAGAPWWSVALVALSPLLLGYLLVSRYDLWPAALLAGALAALLADRHRLGWGLLGAAMAAKLYQLVLVPIAVLWTLRRRGRRELVRAGAIGGAVVAAAYVPFLLIAPEGVWDSLWVQLSRPLQIESLAASLVTTFGDPDVVSSHGSQNVDGYGTLAALSSLCGVVSLGALWVGFARGPADRERFVRYSAAAVCVFVVFGKVLSPQYLIWLVPLVALVRGWRSIAALAVAILALGVTGLWFPGRYWDYANDFELAWAVLLRNVLLVGLLAALALPFPRRRAG